MKQFSVQQGKIQTRSVGPLMYIALPFILYGFAIIVPLFVSGWYSLHNWSGGKTMTFLGLGNYQRLLSDTLFIKSLVNNFRIIVLCVLGQIGIALLVCSLYLSRQLFFREIHRVVIFIPTILSAIVVGFLWRMVYNRDQGLLNTLLSSLGLERWILNWLDDPNIVLTAVSIPLIWQYVGEYVVIFMAAIQGIEPSILEVAELDGAYGLKKMWYIVIPQIRPTLSVALMLCISGNMKVFDHIYVMTSGGPGTSSTVLAQYAYKNSFMMNKFGYGSAVSIGILVVSLALILLSKALLGGRKADV